MNLLTGMTIHVLRIVYFRACITLPPRKTSASYSGAVTEWTFLTNHTHVLVCLSENHELRIRDIAERVGITERGTQRIVAELVASGYLVKTRDGRRNRYSVVNDVPLRHPLERSHSIGDLLRAVADTTATT